MRNSAIIGAVLATYLSGTASVAAPTVTVYTDRTEWENALGGVFLTEDFSDSQLNDGVSFVSSESGHINPAEECYQDVLASESQNEPQTTWSFSPGIIAFGGNWTLGGPGGSGNSLLVYLADSSLYVGTISNSYGGEFWGFISDTPFTSVQLIGGGGTNQQHYCLDDMVYSPLMGDLNCDGVLDLFDIDPFVLALTSAPETPPFDSYLSVFPDCDPLLADMNDDGEVNLFDIDPFVILLTGQ